ncbi:hypothetical protein DEU56DRAFT_952549 [Suillus clintonianus]|uniref:uncharacterized protein n=1 Tax=Suillus clintonianus TaxID=1904413 RepID=UPI001B86B0F5|nr:uncharacterized protein DEU56DRAFT_952549 [Suillus clintonianus]KAG2132335.1 hypothetical protein DEU56DRAFT_952549 [Suillus clintonianus]
MDAHLNLIFRTPGLTLWCERVDRRPSFDLDRVYLPDQSSSAEGQGKNLKSSKHGTPDSMDHVTKRFDETTNRLFRDKKELQFVPFGSPLDKDLSAGIHGGQLKLDVAEVAEFFEPSIQAAGGNHVNQSPGLNDRLFVVRLERLAPLKITVNRTDSPTSKAAADGALGFCCDHHVSARMSRFVYGVKGEVLADRLCELPSGPRLLPGAFDCILARCVKVKESTVFLRKCMASARDDSIKVQERTRASIVTTQSSTSEAATPSPPTPMATERGVRSNTTSISHHAPPTPTANRSIREVEREQTISSASKVSVSAISQHVHTATSQHTLPAAFHPPPAAASQPAPLVTVETCGREAEPAAKGKTHKTTVPPSPIDPADTTVGKSPGRLAEALISVWGSTSKANTPGALPLLQTS